MGLASRGEERMGWDGLGKWNTRRDERRVEYRMGQNRTGMEMRGDGYCRGHEI